MQKRLRFCCSILAATLVWLNSYSQLDEQLFLKGYRSKEGYNRFFDSVHARYKSELCDLTGGHVLLVALKIKPNGKIGNLELFEFPYTCAPVMLKKYVEKIIRCSDSAWMTVVSQNESIWKEEIVIRITLINTNMTMEGKYENGLEYIQYAFLPANILNRKFYEVDKKCKTFVVLTY